MRIAAGIIGVLLVLAIIYFFLPVGVKRVVNPFYKSSTVATRTSPVPSSRATVSSDAPDSFINLGGTARPSASATAIALASTRATATPRASATTTTTIDPFASTPSGTRVAGLPGTGDQDRNPEVLVIEMLASVLVIMLGYKLSKHI
jgi:hypothetical protein